MSVHPPGQKSCKVVRYTTEGVVVKDDVLAEEEPLEITIAHRGRRHVAAITMRTPGRDTDLAVGFLFTEGLLPPGYVLGAGAREKDNRVRIPWPSDLSLDLRTLDRHSYTSSSCGVCGKTAVDQVFQAAVFPDDPRPFRVAPDLLYTLPVRLRTAQTLFEATGAIHAAGVFDDLGNLRYVAEDVGRHNALDKLVGRAYREDALPLYRSVLVLSGRASFELVQKAAMAGIPVVISVGAPSTLAVELADSHGITLCGFVRPESLNAYANPERLT